MDRDLYPYAISVTLNQRPAVIDALAEDGLTVLSLAGRANDAGPAYQNTVLTEYSDSLGTAWLEIKRNIGQDEEILVCYGADYWGIPSYPTYPTLADSGHLPYYSEQYRKWSDGLPNDFEKHCQAFNLLLPFHPIFNPGTPAEPATGPATEPPPLLPAEMPPLLPASPPPPAFEPEPQSPRAPAFTPEPPPVSLPPPPPQPPQPPPAPRIWAPLSEPPRKMSELLNPEEAPIERQKRFFKF